MVYIDFIKLSMLCHVVYQVIRHWLQNYGRPVCAIQYCHTFSAGLLIELKSIARHKDFFQNSN